MTYWLDMDPALGKAPIPSPVDDGGPISSTRRRTAHNNRLLDAGVHPATGKPLKVQIGNRVRFVYIDVRWSE